MTCFMGAKKCSIHDKATLFHTTTEIICILWGDFKFYPYPVIESLKVTRLVVLKK